MPNGSALSDINEQLDDLLEFRYGLGSAKKFRETFDENEDYADRIVRDVAIDASRGSMKKGIKRIQQEVLGRYPNKKHISMMKDVERLYPLAEMANEFNRFGDTKLINEIPEDDIDLFMALLDRMTEAKDSDARGKVQKIKDSFMKVGAPRTLSSFLSAAGEFLPGAADEDQLRRIQTFRQAAELRGRGQRAVTGDIGERFREGDLVGAAGAVTEKGAMLASEMAPPILSSIGMVTPGAAMAFWTAQMAPDVLDEMRDRGVSDDLAKPIALTAGAVMGLIEKLQIKGLGKGILDGAETAAQKGIMNALATIGKREAKELGTQLLQENLQEITQIAATSVGRYFDDNADKFSGQDLIDIKDRLTETTINTALATPFLRAPGAVAQAVGDIKGSSGNTLKQTVMKPDGAQWFAQNYPEQAEMIATAEKPSRKLFQEVFGPESRWNEKERQAFQNEMKKDNLIKTINAAMVEQKYQQEREDVEGRREMQAEEQVQAEAQAEMDLLAEEAMEQEIVMQRAEEAAQSSKMDQLDADYERQEREAIQSVEKETEAEKAERLRKVEETSPADFGDLNEEERKIVDSAVAKGYNTTQVQKEIRESNPYRKSYFQITEGKIKPPKVSTEQSEAFFNDFPQLEAKGKDLITASSIDEIADNFRTNLGTDFGDAGSVMAEKDATGEGWDQWNVARSIIKGYRKFNTDLREATYKEALQRSKVDALKDFRMKRLEAEEAERIRQVREGTKKEPVRAKKAAPRVETAEMREDTAQAPKKAIVEEKKQDKPTKKAQVSETRVNGGVLKETFPGSQVTKNDTGWTVKLKGGTEFEVIMTDDIPVDVDTVMRDYGVTRKEAIEMAKRGASGAVVSAGVSFKLSDGTMVTSDKISAILDRAKADEGSVRHEGLHIAKELGFFETKEGKKLWDALEFEYGSEENIAKAREVWKGQDGLWAKIVQFFHRLKARLGFEWNPEAALNETFTEEFWAQGAYDFEKTPIKYQLEDPIVSIKNEVVDELRNLRGVDALEGVEAESRQQWLDEAVNVLRQDYSAGARLVEELRKNARILSDRETAILQLHYRNEYNKYQRLSDDLFKAVDNSDGAEVVVPLQREVEAQLAIITAIEEATRDAGREWGRAGVARQIALKKDFSLAGMERRARALQGGRALDRDQQAEIKKLSETVERLEKRLQEESDKVINLEREAKLLRQMKDDTAAAPKRRSVAKKRKAIQDVGNVLANLGFDVAKKTGGIKFQVDEDATGAAGDGEIIQELYDAAKTMAEAFREEGLTSASSFIAAVRDQFGSGIAETEATFRKAWEDTVGTLVLESEAIDVDVDNPRSITREARRIQRELVEAGILDQDMIIDAVHEELQTVLPDMTRNEAIDALSAYGQFTTPSREEIDVQLRELNARHLQLSKHLVLDESIRLAKEWREAGLSDEEIAQKLVDEGLQLKATGMLRDKPSDIVRHMIAKTNELKKELPPLPGAVEGQLQTALDAAKRATRNRISDLQWEIRNKERIVKERNELKADPELEALRKERDELMVEHKKMFPSKGASLESRIKAAEAALDKSIERLEKQIQTGDFSPLEKGEPLSTPEIDAKRARLKALHAQKKALQPKMSPEERARRVYEANVLRRIADYEERIREQDFEPRKKKEPRTLSDNELKLKKRLEDTKQEFLKKAGEWHLANLGLGGKILDYARETAHLSRALMTSIDLSAVFRQGGLAVYSHPMLANESAKKMLKAFVSKQSAFNSAEEIKSDPLGQFALTAGLSITDQSGKITRQEEAFMGRWSEKIPGVAGSERAYVTFLNNMRFQLFKMMVSNLGKGGQATLDEAKAIANYINIATGRANFKMLNNAAANMNTIFFAPRYVASRFQYLALPFYLPFTNTTSRVKKAIYAEYGRTIAGASIFIGSLFALAGLAAGDDDEEPTFELDPRSSDFMKIKIGDTRLDPLAGLQQAIVFSARMLTGKIKSTQNGKVISLSVGEDEKRKPYSKTRADVAGRFLRTKMGPIPGAITTALNDMTDVVGKKHTVSSLMGGLFVPLSIREVADSIKQRGIPKGTAISILALLGMGVGTYGKRTQYLDGTKEQRDELFDKDLDRAEYGDGPLPYASHMTEEMLVKYEQAKYDHLVKKATTLARKKPMFKSKAEAWERDVELVKEWIDKKLVTREQVLEAYAKASRSMKDRKARARNIGRLRKVLGL